MAAGYDGSIRIDTKIDTKGFESGRKQVESGLSGITKSLKGMAAAVGVAFGVKSLVAFGAKAVSLASDLQEVQNVVDTAFGDMSYMVEDFAKNAAEQFGMSELSAKRTASTYMAMSKGLGMAAGEAASMSIDVAGLSGDMASFYNVSQSVADTALKSIWTGETETLKQFGVVMTQANLQQFAYQRGIQKSIQSMSQAEQVQLRYQYVTQQLAIAQGDFAKTSGSWANQTRILSERWNEFLAIVGSGLMQVLTPLLQTLNAIVSKMIDAAKAISQFFGLDTSSQQKSQTKAIQKNVSAQQDYTQAVKDTNKEIKNQSISIDELNQIDTSASSDPLAAATGGPTESFAAGPDETNLPLPKETPEWLQNIARDLEPVISALGRLKAALEPIAEAVKSGLGYLWNEILKPMGSWTINTLIPKFLDTITVGLGLLNAAIDVIRPSLEFFYKQVLEPIGKWVGGIILDALDWLQEKMKDFTAFLEEHKEEIQKILDTITMVVGWLWENVIQHGLTSAWETIKSVLSVIYNFTKGIIDSVIDIFSGLIDFITGIFTGDFDKAFSGAKRVLAGFVNFFITIAEAVVNLVRSVFNGLISGLNMALNLINKIPGVEIPLIPKIPEVNIPRLAQGTVIPANYGEYPAILGDNRREPEVVSPLSTMRQAVKEAMSEMGTGGVAEMLAELREQNTLLRALLDKNINVNIGDDAIYKSNQRAAARKGYRFNGMGVYAGVR